VAVTGA